MPIPGEILRVERPANTIVIAHAKDKKLYAVRQRIGCRYVDGKRKPLNGPTIGHIIDGRYLPIPADIPMNVSSSPIDLEDRASVALCDR